MSVTAPGTVARVSHNIRNGPSSDWLRQRENRERCEWCERCGADLRGGVVWRVRARSGWMIPVCESCAGAAARWARTPRPCERCGRVVVETERHSRRTFCCPRCRHLARLEGAKAARALARPTRECPSCGEGFEPVRTDARFCSNACRQRAYRERKAVTP